MAAGHLLARYRFPPSTLGFQSPLAAAAAPGVLGDDGIMYTRRASAGGPRPHFLDRAAPCPTASFRTNPVSPDTARARIERHRRRLLPPPRRRVRRPHRITQTVPAVTGRHGGRPPAGALPSGNGDGDDVLCEDKGDGDGKFLHGALSA